MAFLMAMIIASLFVVSVAAVQLSKATHARHTGSDQPVLSDKNNYVIGVGKATTAVPLIAMLAMTAEQLGRVRQLTISCNDPDLAGKRAVETLIFVKQKKVGVAIAVVLTDPLGLRIRLSGTQANLVKLDSAKIPLCAASATCASF